MEQMFQMSNIIPPLLSDSPPPIPDDEEDEFGDFNSAIEASYAYDGKVSFFCYTHAF